MLQSLNRLILEPQILATDFCSHVMTSVVGVFLALATIYVFRIARNFLCYFVKWVDPVTISPESVNDQAPLLSNREAHASYDSTTASSNGTFEQSRDNAEGTSHPTIAAGLPGQAENSTESHGYLDRRTNWRAQSDAKNPHTEGRLLKILAEAGGSRDFYLKSVTTIYRGGNGWEKFFAFLMTFALLIVFAGWVSLGLTSAKIASNRAGLLSSSQCGVYQFDDKGREEAGYRDDLHNREKEERSSRYAQNCYSQLDPANALTCKVFYQRGIEFVNKSGEPCPFSLDICNDLNSAVTFDTGLVDAEALGINAPNLPKWRRRTSCSPLNMSMPYVTSDDQSPLNRTYYYNYGHVEKKDDKEQEYTTSTRGNPYDWIVPVYHVEYATWKERVTVRKLTLYSVYHSSLTPGMDHWFPISELERPADGDFAQSTMTIIFILSAHISHEKPSHDPIFPAETRNKDGWYNADPQARVLACVDQSEMYSPDGSQHWEIHDPLLTGFSDHPGTWLMRLAMEYSNTKYAMHWRLGSALLAQKRISHYLSRPLEPNQWEFEASQFFATSLARIQYDAWAIASGEDHERSGYVDATPDETKGNLCGIYKLRTTDHTNVSLVGFLGYIVLAVVIYFLSWEVPWKHGDSPITPVVLSFIITWLYNKCAECANFRKHHPETTQASSNGTANESHQELP